MLPGTERLMPWRTLIEVAKVMKNHGYDVMILSGEKGINTRIYQNINIVSCSTDLTEISLYIQNEKPDVLFFPISRRDGLKNLNPLSTISCHKVAYVPGGVYPNDGVIKLLMVAGKNARSYILDNLTSYRLLTRKLSAITCDRIITLTEYTRKKFIKSGWDKQKIKTILPGKDDFNNIEPDEVFLEKKGLTNSKYYLFMGAPAPIRGSIQLLNSFEEFANNTNNGKLVMCMRTDNSSDYSFFNSALNKSKSKNKISVITDKLDPQQLRTILKNAHAVILPFILIPSEIPLTYFEVLSCGIPIITYKNGGTYDYLQSCVLAAKGRSRKSLTNKMIQLWDDQNLWNKLSNNALALMSKHPTWEEVGKLWIKEIEQ